jgi:hypothetical protein
MKKLSISLLMLFVTTCAIAQSGMCAKIKQLIAEANKKQLQNEATGAKFQTADDFDAWTASTTLDGALRCYVQDAHVAKMYVAEFGTAPMTGSADPGLAKKADQLGSMLKLCLSSNFVYKEVKTSSSVLKGLQFDGRIENKNTRVSLLLISNPADKKQLLFISIINDPD